MEKLAHAENLIVQSVVYLVAQIILKNQRKLVMKIILII